MRLSIALVLVFFAPVFDEIYASTEGNFGGEIIVEGDWSEVVNQGYLYKLLTRTATSANTNQPSPESCAGTFYLNFQWWSWCLRQQRLRQQRLPKSRP